MVLLIFCRTKNTFSRGKYYPYYESCNKCNSVYNPNANPKNEVAYKKQTNKQTKKHVMVLLIFCRIKKY